MPVRHHSVTARHDGLGLSPLIKGLTFKTYMQNIALFSAEKANAGLDFTTPLTAVLNSHRYILGDEVKSFERAFANYVGVDHCISVANGSDALELALRGLGIEPGMRVATVANAGFYGSAAIHAIGARPAYVDVDPVTLTLCPKALAALLDTNIAAILVTHLYGQLANMAEIIALAATAGVPVIEDCAQAHGAQCKDQQAGSFGDLACFSFYPTKNLGALGDGGAILTNNDDLATRIHQLRQYGWSRKYHVAMAGGRNSRMDEIQAAILRMKLPYLDDWNEQRRSIAKCYNAAFAGLDLLLPCSTGLDYVGHLYVVRVKDRAAFAAALKDKLISTDSHYPIADHLQPAYQTRFTGSLTHTELACQTVISLPCFPGMAVKETERVIAAVTAYFAQETSLC